MGGAVGRMRRNFRGRNGGGSGDCGDRRCWWLRCGRNVARCSVVGDVVIIGEVIEVIEIERTIESLHYLLKLFL